MEQKDTRINKKIERVLTVVKQTTFSDEKDKEKIIKFLELNLETPERMFQRVIREINKSFAYSPNGNLVDKRFSISKPKVNKFDKMADNRRVGNNNNRDINS